MSELSPLDASSDSLPFDAPADTLLDLFENSEFEVEGRMPYSSNLTLLVHFTDSEERDVRAIYKPGQGERPLWDFPENLYRREVAMYRLSAALGWTVIPPTTFATGMMGDGSVQAFVNADFSEHYFTLFEAGTALDDLQKLCLLDVIGNNTDRKSGHCLLGPDGHVYGIDNGLSFHSEFKLRTVIWDFAGDPIPETILADVARFVDVGPPIELAALLNPFEQDAVRARARAVLNDGRFPLDDTEGHRWPWPLV
ncbi:MAG: SCO1664 family protein [Acidimicrobiales bacterium]|nr:SCO1664 family protein [Acidimicrobiales bacterium]